MNIALPIEQVKWLEEQVATGTFASVEDGVRLAVAGLIDLGEDDELAWARPLVDEARAAIERGDGISAAEAKAEIEALLRSLNARCSREASHRKRVRILPESSSTSQQSRALQRRASGIIAFGRPSTVSRTSREVAPCGRGSAGMSASSSSIPISSSTCMNATQWSRMCCVSSTGVAG